MYLDFTPAQCDFRDELRGSFERLISPRRDELEREMRTRSEGGGPVYRGILEVLGAEGLLGIGWPREFGGQGRGPIEQYIFTEEIQRTGFPLPFLTLNTVGPTTMRYGSAEQKQRFLPPILQGRLQVAIGYSEAEAGTDLAGLKTRAERHADGWLINGAKMWTSLADHADYVWLAARTDPKAPKHRGISIFMIPTSLPGFKCTPIMTIGGVRTNATWYEDVVVPAENLIGVENHGWSLITGQLNEERVSLSNYSALEELLDDAIRWARDAKLVDGRRVIDQPWVQSNLARVYAKPQALRLMNYKLAWSAQQRVVHPADASAVKVFGSEFYVEAYRALLECMGPLGTVQDGSPGAILRGRVERNYRNTLILTFGGGTNEIQRDIIAMAALGMPHYKN
ncbi:MAG: acyl-CoA dehydrogenase [Myxococcales bacterium]|nr:MAG: acyl-CoA dehydrogenase [Myxococcales bacterium]